MLVLRTEISRLLDASSSHRQLTKRFSWERSKISSANAWPLPKVRLAKSIGDCRAVASRIPQFFYWVELGNEGRLFERHDIVRNPCVGIMGVKRSSIPDHDVDRIWISIGTVRMEELTPTYSDLKAAPDVLPIVSTAAAFVSARNKLGAKAITLKFRTSRMARSKLFQPCSELSQPMPLLIVRIVDFEFLAEPLAGIIDSAKAPLGGLYGEPFGQGR